MKRFAGGFKFPTVSATVAPLIGNPRHVPFNRFDKTIDQSPPSMVAEMTSVSDTIQVPSAGSDHAPSQHTARGSSLKNKRTTTDSNTYDGPFPESKNLPQVNSDLNMPSLTPIQAQVSKGTVEDQTDDVFKCPRSFFPNISSKEHVKSGDTFVDPCSNVKYKIVEADSSVTQSKDHNEGMSWEYMFISFFVFLAFLFFIVWLFRVGYNGYFKEKGKEICYGQASGAVLMFIVLGAAVAWGYMMSMGMMAVAVIV